MIKLNAAGKADKRAAASGAGNINYQFYWHRFAEPNFAKIRAAACRACT